MTRTTRLSDLQLILLSTASQRDDGSLLPPDSVGERTPIMDKAIMSLIRRGLAAGIDTSDASVPLPADRDRLVGVRITGKGRSVLGLVGTAEETDAAAASAVSTEPRQQTKASQVLTMLQREEGATLDELVAATGWLPHTTRAALTGLRKKGHAIDRRKRGEVTCYHLEAGQCV